MKQMSSCIRLKRGTKHSVIKYVNNSKMIDYRIDSWYNITNVKICASKEISYR